jgi:2-oxo-4-hydroxy-4-carboxy--5-ureidoimidazoline (OHCU) decarboxylase
LAIGLIPLLVRVAREFKKHKREEREQLLREYPELAEILHSNRGR